MRRTLRVAFRGFWPGFGGRQFVSMHNYLKRRYRIVEDETRPQIVVWSVFADRRPAPWKGVPRVLFSGEWAEPDMSRFDWALTMWQGRHERHRRLPYWAPHVRTNWGSLDALVRQEGEAAARSAGPLPGEFCAFVYRNPVARRERFFELLSRYKRVTAPGASMNNAPAIGGKVREKTEFLSRFKFVIAFENQSAPGYVTEKIADAFVAGCVPVYAGDAAVRTDFDPSSFLDAGQFSCDEALVERVIALDRDEGAYRAMRSRPCYHGNRPPEEFGDEAMLGWWARVIGG